MPKKKKAVVKEDTFQFTLEDWNKYKNDGTNTGIVKDFPDWLEENK